MALGSSSSTSSSSSSVSSRQQGLSSWINVAGTAATTTNRSFEFDKMSKEHLIHNRANALSVSDINLSFPERALSAAGAAFISAILVNPLDVAKVTSGFSFF